MLCLTDTSLYIYVACHVHVFVRPVSRCYRDFQLKLTWIFQSAEVTNERSRTSLAFVCLRNCIGTTVSFSLPYRCEGKCRLMASVRCRDIFLIFDFSPNLSVFSKPGRLHLKCDGTRWRTAGEVKGKLTNGVGSQYPSRYLGTRCIQHY